MESVMGRMQWGTHHFADDFVKSLEFHTNQSLSAKHKLRSEKIQPVFFSHSHVTHEKCVQDSLEVNVIRVKLFLPISSLC